MFTTTCETEKCSLYPDISALSIQRINRTQNKFYSFRILKYNSEEIIILVYLETQSFQKKLCYLQRLPINHDTFNFIPYQNNFYIDASLKAEIPAELEQTAAQVAKIKVFWREGGEEKSGIATCFLLKLHYIITNYHVFQRCKEKASSHEEFLKCLENTKVVFENLNGQEMIFRIKPEFEYFSPELDFAILELQWEGDPNLPTGLLANIDKGPYDEVALIGYPKGGPKSCSFSTIHPTDSRKQLIQSRLEEAHKIKRTELIMNSSLDAQIEKFTQPHVLLYDTYFHHGASGSPIVSSRGLVGLHFKGVSLYKIEKKNYYLVEAGISIVSIKECIKKNWPELYGKLWKF
ncbi:serine protease FAM111A-like [Latimeria chalumnae]|uniref:serine protease FAM111A-like n=1 Tax=Latimeria chalumnae TaxID=7897 RepID=UPI00313F0CF9